ncbi:MAG: dihydroorotate dehydrogenase electron transfer subunit, partial [Abditibacteriota bacterium]|nr:dihydroorotate dehydrogenase electron transfer subunit [Abditibacteriota bacterium]
MPYIVNAQILSNEPIADKVMRLVLKAPEIAAECVPGQFVNLRVSPEGTSDPLLQRPFSVCNAEDGALTLVYAIVGKGTMLLSRMRDTCRITGPLGNGFPLKGGDCLLAGGGLGCAPLYYLDSELRKQGAGTTVITGFSGEGQIFTRGLFPDAIITTDDGSCGIKGFATAAMEEYLAADSRRPVTVYVCGPTPMMKAAVAVAAKYPRVKDVWVSLENVMACGIGVCTGCVCRIKNGTGGSEYKRVCKDGPVFDGE